MARAKKPKAGKSKAKKPAKAKAKTKKVVKKTKPVKVAAKAKAKAKPAKKAAPKKATKKAAPAKKTEAKKSEKKKISPKLLEAIKSRKKTTSSIAVFTSPVEKPRGRRGRRPKGDYQPYNEDEEQLGNQQKPDGLEYDTGIKFEGGSDDTLSAFERTDDFEKELDFDW